MDLIANLALGFDIAGMANHFVDDEAKHLLEEGGIHADFASQHAQARHLLLLSFRVRSRQAGLRLVHADGFGDLEALTATIDSRPQYFRNRIRLILQVASLEDDHQAHAVCGGLVEAGEAHAPSSCQVPQSTRHRPPERHGGPPPAQGGNP